MQSHLHLLQLTPSSVMVAAAVHMAGPAAITSSTAPTVHITRQGRQLGHLSGRRQPTPALQAMAAAQSGCQQQHPIRHPQPAAAAAAAAGPSLLRSFSIWCDSSTLSTTTVRLLSAAAAAAAVQPSVHGSSREAAGWSGCWQLAGHQPYHQQLPYLVPASAAGSSPARPSQQAADTSARRQWGHGYGRVGEGRRSPHSCLVSRGLVDRGGPWVMLSGLAQK